MAKAQASGIVDKNVEYSIFTHVYPVFKMKDRRSTLPRDTEGHLQNKMIRSPCGKIIFEKDGSLKALWQLIFASSS